MSTAIREHYAREIRPLLTGFHLFCLFNLEKIPAEERHEHYEAIEAEILRPGSELRVYREGSPLIYIVRRKAPEKRK